MKTILLPFHDEEAGRTALDAASLVAQRFGSYLEGLLVQETPQLNFGRGMTVPAEYLSEIARHWRQFADSAREHFRMITGRKECRRANSRRRRRGRSPAGARSMDGRPRLLPSTAGYSISSWSAGHPASRRADGRRHARRHCSRPAGQCCSRARGHRRRSAIPLSSPGTDQRKQRARWRLAMPLLTAASRVIVMSVESGMMPGPSGREMAQHLVRNGIAAEAILVPTSGRTVGETIIRESEEAAADLLVKGAYTTKPVAPSDLRRRHGARDPTRPDAGIARPLKENGAMKSRALWAGEFWKHNR